MKKIKFMSCLLLMLTPTPLSLFSLEQCPFISWALKQSQATNLGQHIYFTWVNKCLSTVDFVPLS